MSFSIAGSGAAPSPEQIKAMRAKFEERAFAAADKDANGSVSKTEFAAVKPKDAPAGAPGSDEVFAKIDSDGDGSLTKTEFSAFGDRLSAQVQSQLNGLRGSGGLPPQGPPPGKAAEAYNSQSSLLATLTPAQSDDESQTDEISKLLKAALTTTTA
jgi:Ca2+-binding EF-hand superfamily protein